MSDIKRIAELEGDLFTRHLDPKDVAAIFVEPIQGEGGYLFPPDGFLRALREGMHAKVALTYVEWAGSHHTQVIVPWRVIEGRVTAPPAGSTLL